VSHQVEALKAELGTKLFSRERQRLLIPGRGANIWCRARYARSDRRWCWPSRATSEFWRSDVSTSPDFAANWLVHRLGRFAKVAPAFPGSRRLTSPPAPAVRPPCTSVHLNLSQQPDKLGFLGM
jgi:DNA-binding transcriptional LysR family regulator